MSFPIAPSESFEDTLFQAGDSPATFDFTAASPNGVGGRADGYLACDGAGNILVAVAHRETTFGENLTIRSGEILNFEGLAGMRLTHSGTDSSYRLAITLSRDVRR